MASTTLSVRFAADQADKVRACLQPVRERLLDVMLPSERHSTSLHETTVAPNGSHTEKEFKLDGGQTILLTDDHLTFTAIGTPFGANGNLIGVSVEGKVHPLSVGSSIDLPSSHGSCKVTLLSLIKERRGGDFLLKC